MAVFRVEKTKDFTIMCFDDDTDYDLSTWNEKITDSLNYLFLLKAIVKEGHTNQPN